MTDEQIRQLARECADKAVRDAQLIWEAQHSAMYDPVFDKNEVARIFKVSARTIDTWIAGHILKPTKIGGVVRFDAVEVARVKQLYRMK